MQPWTCRPWCRYAAAEEAYGKAGCADKPPTDPECLALNSKLYASRTAYQNAQPETGSSGDDSSGSSSTGVTVAVVVSVVVVACIVAGAIYFAKQKTSLGQQVDGQFTFTHAFGNPTYEGPGDGDLYVALPIIRAPVAHTASRHFCGCGFAQTTDKATPFRSQSLQTTAMVDCCILKVR